MPRREHDQLGERDVPDHALHGIHTERAIENFPLLGRPVHRNLARAYGAVKLAALEMVDRAGAEWRLHTSTAWIRHGCSIPPMVRS